MLWTDDERTYLQELWPHQSIRAIAAIMCRSRNSVCGQIERMRLQRPRLDGWSSDEAAFVEAQWPFQSAARIGAKLGRSRSAVIGKINRLRRAGSAELQHKPQRLNGQRLLMVVSQERTGVPRPPPKPKPKPVQQVKNPAPPAPIQCHCQLIDLDDINCRWPYGDPQKSGFYFCGAVTSDGRPYCNTHMREAHHER